MRLFRFLRLWIVQPTRPICATSTAPPRSSTLRIEAHQRYSERPDDYLEWVLDRLDPHPGDLALDVGCGKGSYHPLLIARGVRAILGVDASPAMVAATQRQANDARPTRGVDRRQCGAAAAPRRGLRPGHGQPRVLPDRRPARGLARTAAGPEASRDAWC